ncbi:hypothetical protein [Escherichia coli]|uniref:hypothetical protein n=2 Tax=Escherichia coli TaxID=562 RepID=UPI003D9CAD9B
MNGFRNSSRNGQVWRWQRAGSRAVSLEVRGFRKEAAEAWLLAARVAPRTDWQQFARQRAETLSATEIMKKNGKKKTSLSKGGQKSFIAYH